MKKIVLSLFVVSALMNFQSCAELQQVVNQLPQTLPGNASSSEVGLGLKQALELGATKGVESLASKDGFFKDEAVKILLPNELKKVDKALRDIGLSSLADDGLKVLNRAAEDAVVEAKPIFVNAISNLSFNDAMSLLTSNNDLAATQYLQNQTSAQLTQAFQPKIENSLDKVGANRIWSNIIQQYNQIPLVKPVNPNLTEYVTQQTLQGLFTKIGTKEKEIRNNVGARTTPLLQKIFAMQDK